MSTKQTKKSHSLGVTFTLELELPVNAENFADAAEAFNGKKTKRFP